MRHSLETALAHELSKAALRAYGNLNAAVVSWDRYREALVLSREGVELARKVGDRQSESWLGGWRCGMLFALGEWDEALTLEAQSDGNDLAVWVACRDLSAPGRARGGRPTHPGAQ